MSQAAQMAPTAGTDCFLPLFWVPGRPRNRLMSAELACSLMGRKWVGTPGTDEPGRRALRRQTQGCCGHRAPAAYGAGPPWFVTSGGWEAAWGQSGDPGWAGITP